MLDNQYSRVIRWVNRAQSMSAGGKYSDAILDVECARAELDDARQELLLCHKAGSERKNFPAPVLAVVTAFCVVFFMASPLQVALLPTDEAEQFSATSVNSSKGFGVGTTTEVGKKVFLSGDRSSDEMGSDFEEEFSEGDVFRLVEVGRRALQKGEGSLVLDFN